MVKNACRRLKRPSGPKAKRERTKYGGIQSARTTCITSVGTPSVYLFNCLLHIRVTTFKKKKECGIHVEYYNSKYLSFKLKNSRKTNCRSLWFASLDVAQYLSSAKTSQDCNVLFPSVFPTYINQIFIWSLISQVVMQVWSLTFLLRKTKRTVRDIVLRGFLPVAIYPFK